MITAQSEMQHFALCGRSESHALSINITCLRHVSVPMRTSHSF